MESAIHKLWRAFHQEIQFYYYNGEHIYDTPNRERDYERMDPFLMQFIDMMMAEGMGGQYAGVFYDEQKMKAAIIGILDMVEWTMRETAAKVGDKTTIKVLAKVRKWAKQPA